LSGDPDEISPPQSWTVPFLSVITTAFFSFNEQHELEVMCHTCKMTAFLEKKKVTGAVLTAMPGIKF